MELLIKTELLVKPSGQCQYVSCSRTGKKLITARGADFEKEVVICDSQDHEEAIKSTIRWDYKTLHDLN